MAQLLGSRYCIESLRRDVGDLDSSVSDLLSRVGPVRRASWKYPDRLWADVDVGHLLEVHGWSEDEEERQVTHVVLLELVIDRLVLLLQASSLFAEQLGGRGTSAPLSAPLSKPPSAASQPATGVSSSVGPTAKKFWDKLRQTNSAMLRIQAENRSKSQRIAELEDQTAPTHSPITDRQIVPPGGTVSQRPPPLPGRDESSKAVQTVETMFARCDACDVAQRCLREVGEGVAGLCEQLRAPSCLAKLRAAVDKGQWLTGSDIIQWGAEQSKDLAAVGRLLTDLRSTLDPLRAEVTTAKRRVKRLNAEAAESARLAALERETSTATQRQFNIKIEEIERCQSAARMAAEQQQAEILTNKKRSEAEIARLRAELQQAQLTNQQLERHASTQVAEMEGRLASKNREQVADLERHIAELRAELGKVSTRLRDAGVELNKERLKNSSVSKQSEAQRSKQSSLVTRLDELDLENESLRVKVSELEVKVTELEQAKGALEGDLKRSRENERLLASYPDLNPHPPAARADRLIGTGDLATDMKNQTLANSLRIRILQADNFKLQHSIRRLLETSGATTGAAQQTSCDFPGAVTQDNCYTSQGTMKQATNGNRLDSSEAVTRANIHLESQNQGLAKRENVYDARGEAGSRANREFSRKGVGSRNNEIWDAVPGQWGDSGEREKRMPLCDPIVLWKYNNLETHGHDDETTSQPDNISSSSLNEQNHHSNKHLHGNQLLSNEEKDLFVIGPSTRTNLRLVSGRGGDKKRGDAGASRPRHV